MFNTVIVIRSLKLSYSVKVSGNFRVKLQVEAVGSCLGSSPPIKLMFGDTGNPIGGTFEAPVANAKIFPGSTPSSKVKLNINNSHYILYVAIYLLLQKCNQSSLK